MKLFIVQQRLAMPNDKCLAAYNPRMDRSGSKGVYVVSEKLSAEDKHRGQVRPVIVGECDPDEGWTIFYADQE